MNAMASDKESQRSQKEIPMFTIKSASVPSYVAVTQMNSFPKRDQGLILDCVANLTLTDYTCAVGDIVQPSNVISASRISNNRVCLYLANKELVISITDKHEYLKIGEEKVNIRPLLSKHKKVIFSNVPTNLPNSIFDDILEQLNVKRTSPITVLKATIDKEGYNHVVSFRRQVYIRVEDIKKIPEMFKINYEAANYFIYASTDTLKCFRCHIEGHVAKNCTSNSGVNTNNSTEPIDMENSDLSQTSNVDLNTEITHLNTETADETANYIDTTLPDIHNIGIKRTHSVISSSASQEPTAPKEHNVAEFKTPSNKESIKPKNKKTKSDTIITYDEMLEPVKKIMEESKQILNFTELKDLLENLHGSKNPIEIALRYTPDIYSLISLLEYLYPYLNNRTIKRRFTVIIKRLSNPIEQYSMPNTDEESSTQEEN